MSHFLKKTILAISFVIFCTTQSFVCLAMNITGDPDDPHTIFAPVINVAAAGASLDPASMVVGGLITVVGLPAFKTNVIDRIFAPGCCSCSVPSCCLLTSSSDMSIDDLFNQPRFFSNACFASIKDCCSRAYSSITNCCKPALPERHEYVLRGLDGALSEEDSGWDKHVLIDDSGYVVGFEYVLLDEANKAVAKIALVRDYKLELSKANLLRLNPAIRAHKIHDVEKIEDLQDKEVGKIKKPYCYPPKTKDHMVVDIPTDNVPLNNFPALSPEDQRKASDIGLENLPGSVPVAEKQLEDEEEKHPGNVDVLVVQDAPKKLTFSFVDLDNFLVIDREPTDPLEKFKKHFFEHLSDDVEHWLKKALDLHLEDQAQLKLNRNISFCHLKFSSTDGNFQLYLNLIQKLQMD